MLLVVLFGKVLRCGPEFEPRPIVVVLAILILDAAWLWHSAWQGL